MPHFTAVAGIAVRSRSCATRTDQKMTEEEKARELARLREPELPPRTSEQEYYRQRLRRMRQQGVPVRLSVREGWSLPGSNGSSRGG